MPTAAPIGIAGHLVGSADRGRTVHHAGYRMARVVAYAIARLSEASTWRGLVLVATACGAVLSPDQQEAIVTVGLLVAGLLGALLPDAKSRP